MVITGGRISQEILHKVMEGNIPILISKSAPTDLGLRLANDLRATLIGFAGVERANIYTNGDRVVADER